MSRFAAVILAAGAASRYRAGGGSRETKLVEPFEGEPMVRRVAGAALAAGADPIVVVTGHARAAVEEALKGLPLRFVHNADVAAGLSGSLRIGLATLGADVVGALILLGDMPLVTRSVIEEVIGAADAHPLAEAVVPVAGGGRGNPVLLRRSLFAAASRLQGDEGARRLLRDPAITVLEWPVAGEATRFDIDEAAGFAAPAR